MNTPKAFGYILSSQSHDFKQHTPEFHKIFVETGPANQIELMECIKQLHTGDSLHFPSIRSAFNNVDQFSVNWGQIKIYGNCGQIKIYKQALSLHLIATSLIAVRAYQASATAIFDYSS